MLRMLLIVAIAVLGTTMPTLQADETPVRKPRTIAIVPMANLSNDSRLAAIAEGITDLMTVQLSQAKGFVLVERAEIEKLLREQALAGLTRADQSLRLGKVIGAQFVLTGSILEVNGELQLIGQLVEVESARIVKSVKIQSRPEQLDRVMARLSGELLRGLDLDLPDLTDEQIDGSPEANLHFMRGLGLHFARMPDEAIVCFLKALAIDPQHARARFWCASAYADSGDNQHARIEFQRLVKQFPNDPLATRAMRWLAESNTGQEK